VGEHVQREYVATALRLKDAYRKNYPEHARLEDWLAFKSEENNMTPQEREKYNQEALAGHNLDDVLERAKILMCAAEAEYFSEVPAIAAGVKGQAGEAAAKLASELLMQPVKSQELRSGGLYDVVLTDIGTARTPMPRRFATVFWNRVWGRR
jgi:hypothetical protein